MSAGEKWDETKSIWLPYLAIFIPAAALIIVAFIERPPRSLVPEPHEPERIVEIDEGAESAEESRPTPEQPAPDRTAKIEKSLAETEEAISTALITSKGGLTCFEQRVGDTVSITLSARKDFYPLNEFLLESAPRSLRLAKHVIEIEKTLASYRSDVFQITMAITGTADANAMETNLDYNGQKIECECETEIRVLRKGKDILDNELLACARAADFVSYLIQHGIRSTDVRIAGREFFKTGEKDGRYRFVETVITFHNIIKLAPDATFC